MSDDKTFRERIEAMSHEDRLKRLDEISDEVFAMANAFAVEKMPGVAIQLHESVNCIFRSQKAFESKSDEIPVEFLMRSMGTSLMDLRLKDDLYREDLENDSNED